MIVWAKYLRLIKHREIIKRLHIILRGIFPVIFLKPYLFTEFVTYYYESVNCVINGISTSK